MCRLFLHDQLTHAFLRFGVELRGILLICLITGVVIVILDSVLSKSNSEKFSWCGGGSDGGSLAMIVCRQVQHHGRFMTHRLPEKD